VLPSPLVGIGHATSGRADAQPCSRGPEDRLGRSDYRQLASGPLKLDASRGSAHRPDTLVSQRDLAGLAGITQSTVLRLENGRHPPLPSTIRKLARALEVTPAALTTLEST
jgi:DNA-binding XRE family transcriptional regulator